VPIRGVLTLITLLLATLVVTVGTICMRRQDLEAPMPHWRRTLIWPLRPLLRFQLLVLGYFWIEQRGTLAPRSAAPIVVSNHISLVEPILLMWALGATPVSAAENARIPFVGRILLALQAMLVDRERGAKLQSTSSVAPAGSQPQPLQPSSADVNTKIRQRALDDRFPRILLFPEGTTTNGSAVLSFKSGAFKPAVSVQPVVVQYPHTFFDPSWVSEGPSMYGLLLGLMCQIYNRVQVTYLPVYTPSDLERADPQLFADNVQQVSCQAALAESTHGAEAGLCVSDPGAF